jgi:type I site-specific restriction endonuclease
MDFLTQAKALAEEILLITSQLKLTGQPAIAEREVDGYAAMVNRRGPMIAKLTQLLKQDTSGDEALRKQVDDVTRKIIELDKEHKRVMEHLRKSVTASLKEARSGQKLNKAYTHPYEDLGRGLLDIKQ